MRRAVVLCLLALLLSMQQEVQVHAFSHMARQAAHAHDTGSAVALADAGCARCALLAAGSNAVPAALPSLFVAALADEGAGSGFRSRAVAAPACFRSRAPPVLS
jgi:predicted TPR repeat methyltransferase